MKIRFVRVSYSMLPSMIERVVLKLKKSYINAYSIFFIKRLLYLASVKLLIIFCIILLTWELKKSKSKKKKKEVITIE